MCLEFEERDEAGAEGGRRKETGGEKDRERERHRVRGRERQRERKQSAVSHTGGEV